MARPKETNKTLMDQNISYGLNIVQEGIEAQKNGEEIVDSKIDLYEIADSMEYLSRHSDIPFQVLAQKDEKIANCLKKIFFHGVNAMKTSRTNQQNKQRKRCWRTSRYFSRRRRNSPVRSEKISIAVS